MKLLKKLLPVAALASSVSIVTPMVTSCGATLNNVLGYQSQVIQHDELEDGKTWDSYKAELEYFGHENVKTIIKDDWYYTCSLAAMFNTNLDVDIEAKEIYASIENINVEKRVIDNDEYYLLSADTSYKSVIEVTATIQEQSTTFTSKVNTTINQKLNFKNIIYSLAYIEYKGENVWVGYPAFAQTAKLINDCSIDFVETVDTIEEFTYDGKTDKSENKENCNYHGANESLSGADQYVGVENASYFSHYLAKVKGSTK